MHRTPQTHLSFNFSILSCSIKHKSRKKKSLLINIHVIEHALYPCEHVPHDYQVLLNISTTTRSRSISVLMGANLWLHPHCNATHLRSAEDLSASRLGSSVGVIGMGRDWDSTAVLPQAVLCTTLSWPLLYFIGVTSSSLPLVLLKSWASEISLYWLKV